MAAMEDYDIYIPGKVNDQDAQAFGMEIAHNLTLKGFCVLHAGMKDEVLRNALEEVQDLERRGRFEQPPSQISEGLLGEEGSAAIAELAGPSEDAATDGESLRAFDCYMSYAGQCLGPHFEQLGFTGSSRTGGLVIQGGEGLDIAPDLTEGECSKWLNAFVRHRLMILFFMGPGEGTLELQPFDDESGVEEITTRPNMMVILRADALSHRHFSSSSDYTLTCWILGPNVTGCRGVRSEGRSLVALTPAARELVEWASGQLRERKMQQLAEGDEAEWDSNVPRSWQLAMNRSFHQGSPAAVRSTATRFPGCGYEPESYWKCLAPGTDLVTDVPLIRWDHQPYYDAEPDSYKKSDMLYKWVTSIKHTAMCDGIDLFDNKMFTISPSEAKGMDPQQRQMLEVCYESLFLAGYKKKELMNKFIGVFTGSSVPEWSYAGIELSVVGASEAITSNRVSFCLGIQGPSTTTDCEMASSAAAVYVGAVQTAASSDRRKKAGLNTVCSLSAGSYVAVLPIHWPRFNYWMNPVGRCFSFDSHAGGYIRSEGTGVACLKPYLETVDNELSVIDQPCEAVMSGYRMNNNGKNANMQAPHSAAEQEVIIDAMRQAAVTTMDVDGIDAHGAGALFPDAVEVTGMGKCFRDRNVGMDTEAFILSSTKTNMGAPCEACGIVQLIKVIYNQLFGVHIPHVHLRQLNPHIDIDDTAIAIPAESIGYRCRASFHGLTSRGFGGTNVHLLFWNMADEERVADDRPTIDRPRFSYWPAGGGFAEEGQLPDIGYYIVGSWTAMANAEEMTDQGNGTYTFEVTMGASRFESFHIMLDQDPSKMLYPGWPNSSSGVPVYGPSEDTYGLCWTIDARSQFGADGRDRGNPGDRYLVKLLIAGKWRSVVWEKVHTVKDMLEMGAEDVTGAYYISSSWNNWTFDQMEPSDTDPNHLFIEVGPLRGSGEEFQIVRNKDQGQAFYPAHARSLPTSSGEVRGPDGHGWGQNWCLNNKAGDKFRIDFRRTLQLGSDETSISCTKVERTALTS